MEGEVAAQVRPAHLPPLRLQAVIGAEAIGADDTGEVVADQPVQVLLAPVGRDPQTRVGLTIETEAAGRPCRTRADFDAIGLSSRYHSCLIFGFDWQLDV